MKLTQKQEAFCLAYIETGNASDAYRRAYSADKMKPETVNRKAKALIDDGKITARLEDLRRPVVEAARMSLESHLARLDALSRKAENAGQYGAAIAAETNRGRAAGFYTEKVDHTTGGKPLPAPAEPAIINVTIGGA